MNLVQVAVNTLVVVLAAAAWHLIDYGTTAVAEENRSAGSVSWVVVSIGIKAGLLWLVMAR